MHVILYTMRRMHFVLLLVPGVSDKASAYFFVSFQIIEISPWFTLSETSGIIHISYVTCSLQLQQCKETLNLVQFGTFALS